MSKQPCRLNNQLMAACYFILCHRCTQRQRTSITNRGDQFQETSPYCQHINSLFVDGCSALHGLGHACGHAVLGEPRPLCWIWATLSASVQVKVTCQGHQWLCVCGCGCGCVCVCVCVCGYKTICSPYHDNIALSLKLDDTYQEFIAECISTRLWIKVLFSQSMYVRTCVRTYVVGHAQECHAECRYIP